MIIDGTKSKIPYLPYTSPIRDFLRRHGLNCHLYSEKQLNLSFKSNPAEQLSSAANIEACVSEIDSGMVCNELKLNRGKTELLILRARHRPPLSIEYINVSGKQIKLSPSERNIGVIFDEHMLLDEHFTSTCNVCLFHLRNISKI